MVGYYYLHENGDILFKKDLPGIEEDFANSDFVKHYWKVDFTKRTDAWTVLVEGLAAGANIVRVKDLANKWHCTDGDAINYTNALGIRLEQSLDDTWHAFRGKQEATGDSALECLASLCVKVGFKPSNVFQMSFRRLLMASL